MEWQKILGITADVVGIFGITFLTIFNSFYTVFSRNKDNVSTVVSLWLAYISKAVVIFFIGTIIGLIGYYAKEAFVFLKREPIIFSISIILLIIVLFLV